MRLPPAAPPVATCAGEPAYVEKYVGLSCCVYRLLSVNNVMALPSGQPVQKCVTARYVCLWHYCWAHWVDHEHGGWVGFKLTRDNRRLNKEKAVAGGKVITRDDVAHTEWASEPLRVTVTPPRSTSATTTRSSRASRRSARSTDDLERGCAAARNADARRRPHACRVRRGAPRVRLMMP